VLELYQNRIDLSWETSRRKALERERRHPPYVEGGPTLDRSEKKKGERISLGVSGPLKRRRLARKVARHRRRLSLSSNGGRGWVLGKIYLSVFGGNGPIKSLRSNPPATWKGD